VITPHARRLSFVGEQVHVARRLADELLVARNIGPPLAHHSLVSMPPEDGSGHRGDRGVIDPL